MLNAQKHFTTYQQAIAPLFLFSVLLIVILSGCQTRETAPVTFEDILAQTTAELTAAANTLADARDAGIVSADSETYQTAKLILLDAQTYIELAWQYYADGDMTEAKQARQFALANYQTIRPKLVEYQKSLGGE